MADQNITQLIQRLRGGDRDALDALIPLVYEELKKIARRRLGSQAAGVTLTPTALVHDLFLKLRGAKQVEANDRAHFFAIAARSMRWLITDYLRTRQRQGLKIALDESRDGGVLRAVEIPMDVLQNALERLEKMDYELSRIVELRFLVGLTIEETAEVMGISPMTVKRGWKTARTWLSRELADAA